MSQDIKWIRCSEKMPTDDELMPVICMNLGSDHKPTVSNAAYFCFMAKNYNQEIEPEWMEYSDESWDEVNK